MIGRNQIASRGPISSSTGYSRPPSKGSIYGGHNLTYSPTSAMGSGALLSGSYSPQSRTVGASSTSTSYSNKISSINQHNPSAWSQQSPTSSEQRTIGAYPGHKPGTPLYTTTSWFPNPQQSSHSVGSVQPRPLSAEFGGVQSSCQNAPIGTNTGGRSSLTNITCANNNYQWLNKNGYENSYNGSTQQPRSPQSNFQTASQYPRNQQQQNSYSGQNGSTQPQMSIGNYQALNSVRQQQQMTSSTNGNYQFYKEPQAQHQPVAFQTPALSKQPLPMGCYYAQNPVISSADNNNSGQGSASGQPNASTFNQFGLSSSQMHMNGAGHNMLGPASYTSQGNSHINNMVGNRQSVQPYQSSQPQSTQYGHQYKHQKQCNPKNMTPPSGNQFQSGTLSSDYGQNQSTTQASHTIRVGVPSPGQVLEPQTIRVTAPRPPSTQSAEPTMKVVLPKGMQLADPQMLASMALDNQQGGDVGYGDMGSTEDSSTPGGVKYIPLSWGELLGGGKDGLNDLKVVMAAPPPPDSPNQNRQLRVAFGNQSVVTQPGEIPLKVLSINPVEGYKMGPVSGYEGNCTSETEKRTGLHQQPSRTQSLPGTSQISQVPSPSTRTRAAPCISGRMPQVGYSSSKAFAGQNNSNVVARSDFAGTKYY